MEWIIVDDGTDKIEDIIKDHPLVKYFKYDEKMPLGKKRNIMHKKARGSIIVYMDDDDYYPPERVSHAVEMLVKNPEALCAGSSEMYIYFKDTDQMIQFGPYGPKHATAGTFAFRKELLREHKYNNDACLAEEREFLKGYTVPFVQLDSMKTILVFSHRHNTFDKRTLLNEPFSNVMQLSDKKVADFIKAYGWKGRTFATSAISGIGCKELVYAIMDHVEEVSAKAREEEEAEQAKLAAEKEAKTEAKKEAKIAKAEAKIAKAEAKKEAKKEAKIAKAEAKEAKKVAKIKKDNAKQMKKLAKKGKVTADEAELSVEEANRVIEEANKKRNEYLEAAKKAKNATKILEKFSSGSNDSWSH
jgi:glycosyltransferase involved in cell wall biosynthesis